MWIRIYNQGKDKQMWVMMKEMRKLLDSMTEYEGISVRAELRFARIIVKAVQKSFPKNSLGWDVIDKVREGERHDLNLSCMSCIEIM